MLTKQEMDIQSYHSVSKCQELDREIQRPTKQRNTAEILKETKDFKNSGKKNSERASKDHSEWLSQVKEASH